MEVLARFFLMEVDDLKYKKRKNRKEGEGEYVLSSKKLPDWLRDFYCYQLYWAFKASMLRNLNGNFAILAKEMGLEEIIEEFLHKSISSRSNDRGRRRVLGD